MPPAVSNFLVFSPALPLGGIKIYSFQDWWLCLAFHPTVQNASIDSNWILGTAGKVPIRPTASGWSTCGGLVYVVRSGVRSGVWGTDRQAVAYKMAPAVSLCMVDLISH